MVIPVFILLIISSLNGPFLHPDELIIVDLGRNILEPSSNWTVSWIPNIQEPAFLISYLGVVIQELNYEYFGQYGPRIFALLGGIAAATVLIGWLQKRNIPDNIILLLGLVFLLDPLFVQSYTIGRIDGWCMCLCLGSCWIIHDNNFYCRRKRQYYFRLFSAGIVAALAFFIWPSAIFLFPLVFMELFDSYTLNKKSEFENREFFKMLLFFFSGCIILSFLLLIPILKQLSHQLENIFQALYTNTHAGPNYYILGPLNNMLELPRVLKFSPFIFLSAILAFFKLRNRSILISFCIVTVLMVFTVVYIQRVQYLIPYFIIAISALFQKGSSKVVSSSLRKTILTTMLIWAVGLSIAFRTFLIYDNHNRDDRKMLEQTAMIMLGKGEHEVFIPFDFYYSGRSLNWNMHRPYLGVGSPVTVEVLAQLLPKVDYVIMEDPTKEIENEIIKKGFVIKGEYQLYKDPPKPFSGITTNIHRVRNLYSIFTKPYGPYKLYIRKNHG